MIDGNWQQINLRRWNKMNIYKVTMEKIVFVRAENKEDAENSAMDEHAIMIDESIVRVEKTTKEKMLSVFFDNFKGGTTNEET